MRKLKEVLLKIAMGAAVAITCGVLVFLIVTIFAKGVGSITPQFLSTQSSYIDGTIGILPNILNTLYIIIVAMIIVIPLGVCAAVYITEYATNHKVVRFISFATETLTGIPSILFGLVGMLIFTQLMGLKQGILAGGLTLVMMVLPTIVTNTRESLMTVPNSYREGALALGSGKWHMIRTVVLPNSLEGILTGCILSIGRITGESAALLFTAGFGLQIADFFTSLQSSSATLTVALYVYASERGEFGIAFGIAVILLLLTLGLNITASAITKKIQKRRNG